MAKLQIRKKYGIEARSGRTWTLIEKTFISEKEARDWGMWNYKSKPYLELKEKESGGIWRVVKLNV